MKIGTRLRRRSVAGLAAVLILCGIPGAIAYAQPSALRWQEPTTAAERFGWIARDGDEFAGNRLDLDRWRVYSGPGNANVGLRRPSAVAVADGVLKITGRGDVSGGIAWRAGPPITYGRWEFRARSDRGQGYSPVVLLWPDSDRWPHDGEIDLMEIPNGNRAKSAFSLHWGAHDSRETKWIDRDFTKWHVFGVDWSPAGVSLYLDGELVASISTPAAIPRGPMHIAVQNDIGPLNDWIPARDASTPAAVALEVDWVRIYH